MQGSAPPPDEMWPMRDAMVRHQIEARGVRDPAVLAAMRRVPRHRLIGAAAAREAYTDSPLAIGHGQTISQPYIVAYMTELAGLRAGDRVLEIGTGSGYQSAVLAEMGVRVFSIEIVEPLGRSAEAALTALGYHERAGGLVSTRIGDGFAGWPEEAPFDAIMLTAAPGDIPKPLLAQLKVGGRLVAPVGPRFENQSLLVVTRTPDGFVKRNEGWVRFVPMTGRAEKS